MSKENRVSDERLTLIASGIADRLGAGASAAPDLERDIASAITELLSIRSKPVAGVEVKRWLVEETLPSGVIRWQAFEHEHQARKWAASSSGTVSVTPLYASPQPEAVITEEMRAEALRLLKARDERDDKVQEIIEDLREIVLLMPAASRPDGLFKHAQDAVYAMRGRTRLMDDAALTAALKEA